MKRILLTSAAVSALTLPAMAQGVTDLAEISVSASLTDTEQARSAATVEVLDAEALDAPDSALLRSMARLPGVSYSSNGGTGANATLRIRGLDTKYIGVRIDGIDVSDPSSTQTSYNFGGLGAAGLGRVEILKGSQSALYGSNAIGGYVDISTWRPERDGVSGTVATEAGSFGTFSNSLSVGLRGARGEVALSFGRITTDGISARPTNTEKDGFEQTSVMLSGRYALSDAVTLGATLLYRDGEIEIDRSASDPSGENFTEQLGGRVFADIVAFGMEHTISYAQFDSTRRDPGGFTTYFKGERRQLSYLGTADLGAGMQLTVGLDRTREAFDLLTDVGSATITSGQAELKYSPTQAFDLSLALRHDDHSEFGGKTTGRIGAVWRPGNDWTLRAVAGTGFRAPSLFERYSPYGSTALAPESSRSFELGAEKRFGEATVLKAMAFYTEIDDKIGFDGAATTCGSGFGCYNQVPGTTRTRGLELSGSHQINDVWTVFGNYTLTDARTDGTREARVPRHDLVLGLDASLGGGWSGGIDLQRVADVRPSAFAPADHKVGSYTLVNLSVSYDLTPNAKAYLRIENLLDADYETAGGFSQPGRAAFFGLRASF